MDVAGNGLLVEHERLHLAMGIRPENFSSDKFRYMCILSGCDYLPSLPGIGLFKACKFITRTLDTDIHRVRSSTLCIHSRKRGMKYVACIGGKRGCLQYFGCTVLLNGHSEDFWHR